MQDSEGMENREWDKRVSGGRGRGFASGSAHARPETKEVNYKPCRVEPFSKDSVLQSKGEGMSKKEHKREEGHEAMHHEMHRKKEHHRAEKKREHHGRKSHRRGK